MSGSVLRSFGFFVLGALALSLLRLFTDAFLLEPHYFWPIRDGLLAPPLMVGLPLTLWADLAGAATLVVGSRYSSLHGPFSPRWAALLLCAVFAHIGQADPLKLPLIIPAAWVLSPALGLTLVWKLLHFRMPQGLTEPAVRLN